MKYSVGSWSHRSAILKGMTNKIEVNKNGALAHKVRLVANAIHGKKARDIRAFDVRGLTLIADAFVLCTATSEPQLKAVSSAAREAAREEGHAVLRVEGDHKCGWLIIDLGDVILHVFRAQARDFYDLDRMWADAPELPLHLEE